MSDRVPSDEIEAIVGAKRDPYLHQAKAVSAEQTVYVLHSQACLDSGIGLPMCRFSLALDNGIREDEWVQDEPTVVKVIGAFGQTRLVPKSYVWHEWADSLPDRGQSD